MVPVLVGGDNVTIYTDGQYAIPFAETYIHHCEHLTSEDGLPRELTVITRASGPDPLTASAGVAITGRNPPFHIAYNPAKDLVSRRKKLGKKPGASPRSTIDFHTLRDTTVLVPRGTLEGYEGHTQYLFLIGHYAPEQIRGATAASVSRGVPQAQDQWKKVPQTVATFDDKDPDSPDEAVDDLFLRIRASRIIKLLAEDKEEQVATEWGDTLQSAPGAGFLAQQLKLLPPYSSSSDEAGELLEQIRWLLNLIDLSKNSSDGYVAYRIRRDADISGSAEVADDSTEGGAK